MNNRIGAHWLFEKPFPLLEKALNLRSLNHQIISMNLAHLTTPHYRALELKFEEALRSQLEKGPQVLRRTDGRHFHSSSTGQDLRPAVTAQAPGSSRGPDGNSVDEEKEMVRLAENQLHYQSVIQVLTRKMNSLKEVIREGGR